MTLRIGGDDSSRVTTIGKLNKATASWDGRESSRPRIPPRQIGPKESK